MNELTPVHGDLPDLYASVPQSLPFDSSFDIRAFLLRREPGNLLVYSVAAFNPDLPAIQDLGGIARQYLNHWHEAMFVSNQIDAPLFCHEADREHVTKRASVHETFSNRHMLDDDFEVIPTPGHTPGATAFLSETEQHRYLFTSDTIYLNAGEWIAAMLDSSDRGSYIESLNLIRELDFDVLVPWAATHGQPCFARTDSLDARRRIDAIITRLRSGEDF